MKRNVRLKILLSAAAGGLLCALVAPATPAAPAQSRGAVAAVVIYADGRAFTVVDARGLTVGVDLEEPVGLELVAGDTVVTDHETFLELQLVPSTGVVKIAENTNFTIVERGSPRGGSFALVYGKVRARVQTLTGKEKFTIRGESAVAGVRGTDFGVTVEVARAAQGGSGSTAGSSETSPEPAATTQVYCFEGEVEVARPAPVGEGASPAQAAVVVVRANEIVSVAREGELAEAQVQPIPAAVKSYWETNTFKAEPVAAPQAESQPSPIPAAAEKVEKAQAQPKAAEAAAKSAAPAPASEEEVRQVLAKRMTVTRSQVRVASIALFGVGAALGLAGAVDAFLPSVSLLGDDGIGLMSVGAVFVIGGIFSMVQVQKIERALGALRSRGRSP